MSLTKQPTNATRRDPNVSQEGMRHGGVGDKKRRGEYGTVVDYKSDTYVATVQTERGRILHGIPRLRSTPGEIAPLAPGTDVLLSYDYGEPVIMGILARPVKSETSDARFSVTDVEGFGGQGIDKDELNTNGTFRQPSEPDDIMPDDWIQMGPDGNMLGILAGGVNVLKSGPLSQIRTHGINDLIEAICRNYRHISDMGEFTIANNDGRINMRFRGGSDQRNEAGPDEENWTIRFDLGSDGDMLNFELTTPQGQTLFRLHVDSDGQCEIFGVNGVSINSGSQNEGVSAEETSGSKFIKIEGDQTVVINGSRTNTVNTNDAETVVGDKDVSVGNDYRTQTLRDFAIGVGRNMAVSVQGNNLGGDAISIDVEAGDVVTTIGSATSLRPDSGYSLTTFAGDMNFESTAGGSFFFESLLGEYKSTIRKSTTNTNRIPDSVILGGDSLASHLVKYEQLELHLSTLYKMLDAHIHVENGTAAAVGSLPVFGVSGPPVIPFSPALAPQILTLKSLTSGVAL